MFKKILSLIALLAVVLHVSAAPTEPKVSTADEVHWYLLQFLNGNNVLEAKADGAGVRTAAATAKAAQLWKIEGDATTGYTLTNKQGMVLYTTTTNLNGMFQASTTPGDNKYFVWQTTTNTTYADGWVLSPKANTKFFLNQWGGAGTDKELGLWNDQASADQPFQFVDASAFADGEGVLPLIPYPASITQGNGTLNLKQIAVAIADNDVATRYLTELTEQLKAIAGITIPVNNASSVLPSLRLFTDNTLAHEAYTLTINGEGIAITAADSTGFFYGIQTLKQLMPHAIYRSEGAATAINWTVPYVTIADHPQLGHRGYMLDVARHFFSKTEIKRILDVMASYKMNRFHWHLTDDQGWRVEIPEYPRLTTVGAVRKGSFVNAGGSTKFFDDTEYGRGLYFTLDDLREIVAYAKARNIEIIPELDLPGHMVAAVAAYPELSCDPTKSYEVRIDGGISKDVLNVGKDEVIDFLKCVLGHFAEVFPYQYIHLGGDECPTDQWKKNADCLKRVSDEGLTGVEQLQPWLLEKLGTWLKQKYNKDIICWDELLTHWIDANTVKPVIMAWNSIGKSNDAANKGLKSIVSPYQSLYLDMMQVPVSEADVNEKYQGGWGDNFVNSLPTVYNVNPVASLSGKEDYCLGVQANMWTETCNDSVEVEYQLLPRLLALSEVGWLPAAQKSWISFYQRLQKNWDILDAKGLTYATHYKAEKDKAAQEAALSEAESILSASKPGKVGYPSQEEYNKLNNAYMALQVDGSNDALVAALNTAISNYKAAAITLPKAGKLYKLVSASTYYKAKYVGSTAYADGTSIKFHYTPQVEPEELWQFTAANNGYTLTNALSGQQVNVPATADANVTLAAAGSKFTIALATQASGKYSYVPGAVTITADNGKLFSAHASGVVKSGTNAAICYPGTWYIEEVTDFTAQLSGLVKKANNIIDNSVPGAMGEPTEEAIAFLKTNVVTPAAVDVAKGGVTEATYKSYADLYEEYLSMPKVSPIQGLDEGYYYYIRNAYFDTYYAYANASTGAIGVETKGNTDGYLWSFTKVDNGNKVVITNKLTGKTAQPSGEGQDATINANGTANYAWGLAEYTCDEGKTGIQIKNTTDALSWYTNPNVAEWKTNIILRPKTYGASIWLFEKSNIVTGIKSATANGADKNSRMLYDLQGRRVTAPQHGVYIMGNGRKVLK